MSVKGGIQSVDLVAVPVLMGYKKTKKKKIVFFVAFCNFVIVAHSVNLPHLSYFSGQGAGARKKTTTRDGQCRLIAIAIRVWAPINLTRLRLQLQTRRVRFSKRIDKKRESGESRAEQSRASAIRRTPRGDGDEDPPAAPFRVTNVQLIIQKSCKGCGVRMGG